MYRLNPNEGLRVHNYEDVATSIIYQQLYLDDNIIRDRRSEVNIKVEGSKEIIQAMMNLILAKIDLWDKGKEIDYLLYLTKATFVDYKQVSNKFHNKLEPLNEEQLQDKVFRFLLFLSEVVSAIHIQATNNVIKTLKANLKSIMKSKEVQKRLDELSQESSADFSLMLNLGILCIYARINDLPEPLAAFNRYFSKVIKKIKEG
ncbi:MAG: hypothetical protein ACTSXA_05810 [Candidatus Heimdallarchaeota archaeon]